MCDSFQDDIRMWLWWRLSECQCVQLDTNQNKKVMSILYDDVFLSFSTLQKRPPPSCSYYFLWQHRTGSTLARVMACCRQYQAITWDNVHLSSARYRGIHLRPLEARYLSAIGEIIKMYELQTSVVSTMRFREDKVGSLHEYNVCLKVEGKYFVLPIYQFATEVFIRLLVH